MLQGTNWALCSCGPSPWPILKKDSPKYSSQMSNEWEFSCIAQMKQPFPLKYTHRVFPPIKVWSIKKFFILRFQIPPVGNCCSFSSSTMSHLVQWKHSSEREGWRCFSENHLRPSWKGKKKKRSPVSPPTVKNFTTCEAPEQSESFCLCSVVVPAERILPRASLQTLNQHLLDWSEADKLTGWRQIAV